MYKHGVYVRLYILFIILVCKFDAGSDQSNYEQETFRLHQTYDVQVNFEKLTVRQIYKGGFK